MGSQLKYLKFGRYLLGKKIITERDIRTARFIQKKNNHMIGDLARAKGWLNDDDIQKILIIQKIRMKIREIITVEVSDEGK
jgi:hypothetical protein